MQRGTVKIPKGCEISILAYSVLKTEACKRTPPEYGQHTNLSRLHFTKILLLQQMSQILENLARKTESPLLLHAIA